MIAQIPRPNSSYSPGSVMGQLLEREWPEGRNIPTELSFISAFAMLLLGVTVADGQVTVEEKQRFKEILDNVLPGKTKARLLFQKLYGGIKSSRLYLSAEALDCVIQELGASERLLLLVLGYELAMADGDLAGSEADYLSGLAQRNNVDESLLQAFQRSLELGTVASDEENNIALERLRFELDPARFRNLNASFCRAAGRIMERLPKPVNPVSPLSQGSSSTSSALSVDVADGGLSQSLLKHRAVQEQLAQKCDALLEIVLESKEQVGFATDLETELKALSAKMRSQTFRVAIVGEFSQGKSTLLNALLGEEAQPTRMIPCSGAITVLRYGEQRRVIERYYDGTEQEIAFEEYQERASIPEAAALDGRTEALAKSDLKELVLEHPGLELCRHGVELVDSPGLNEHPDRTRLTYQLLENIDALVFLANASRPLTQGERELLQDFRLRLNGGHEDQPAENLFVLVNFMDLVRRKKDQQQVSQLFENFLLGDNALLSSPERLHFTSAQAALGAIVDEVPDDPHLQSLQTFSGALGAFLGQERGLIQIKQLLEKFQHKRTTCSTSIHQAQISLEETKNLASKKIDILEILAETTGRFEKIVNVIDAKYESDLLKLYEIFENRMVALVKRLGNKEYKWVSAEHKGEKEKIEDFSQRFSVVISTEFDKEMKTFFKQDIIPLMLQYLDYSTNEANSIQNKILSLAPEFEHIQLGEVKALRSGLKQIDLDGNISVSDDEGAIAILASLGSGIGAGAAIFAGVTFFPALLVGGALGLGLSIFSQPSDQEIIAKVVQSGLENFANQIDSSTNRIIENFCQKFEEIFENIDSLFEFQITSLGTWIEKIDEAMDMSPEEREAREAYLSRIIQDVEKLA